MPKFQFSLSALSFFGLIFATTFPLVADEAPGLGDPGKLQSLEILSVKQNQVIQIAGKDAARQLIVVGIYDSGQKRDLSRKVTYSSQPAGIVGIDSTGECSAPSA